MSINPCCCASLQRGAKCVALLQAFASLGVLLVTLALAFGGAYYTTTLGNLEERIDQEEINIFAGTISFILVCSVISLALARILWTGARDRKLRRCKVWLGVASIISVLASVAWFGVLEILGPLPTLLSTLPVVIGVVLAINGYCILVVYCFIQELNRTRRNNRLPKEVLSDDTSFDETNERSIL